MPRSLDNKADPAENGGIPLRDANDFMRLKLGGTAIPNTPLLDIPFVITEE